MKKRLLALIMVLSLALSLVPVGAAAPTDAGPADSGATGSAQQIENEGGTTYYKADGTKAESGTLGENGVVVEMSKTIQGTNTENEFDVTLQVKTNQKVTEISTESPDAAVVLVLDVSNSMDDCVNCGRGKNSHRKYSSCKNYQSRLSDAKDAAKAFLQDFVSETGTDGKRMVAIVAFGTNGRTVLNWTDVRTNMSDANAAIENLHVEQNNDYTGNNRPGDNNVGGTNMEAGLMLARNLLNDGRKQTGAISGTDYLYTVLLTDGVPTFHVQGDSNRTDVIKGTVGGKDHASNADINGVEEMAEALQDITRLSKLYSICFGKNQDGSYVYNNALTGKKTIKEWFQEITDGVYNGGQNLDSLLDAFDGVIDQIVLAARAWKVTDSMGENISYISAIPIENSQGAYLDNEVTLNNDKKTFTWDIRASDYNDKESSVNFDKDGNMTRGTLVYTFKYKVRLNNLVDNTLTDTSVNKQATLTYMVANSDGTWPSDESALKTGTFPVPTVSSLYGNLTFTKQGSDGKNLDSVTFTLTTTDKNGWEMKATSTEDGTVTFSNIPSGHTYTLTETLPEQYEGQYTPISNASITVNYGEVTGSEGLFGGTDDALVLTNEANTGSLTVTKTVTKDNDSLTPADKEFTFTISLTKDNEPLTDSFNYTGGTVAGSTAPAPEDGSLESENGTYTLTLKAGQTATITGIPVGTTYTVTETEPGGGFTSAATGDTGEITATGNATASFTNNYSAEEVTLNGGETDGNLLVTKKIDNRDWLSDDSFTFTIAAAENSPEGTPLPTSTSIDLTEENSTVGFGDITYKAPGTYIYEITEAEGNAAGLTYDDTVYTVTVTVKDDGEGNLYIPEDDGVVYKAGDASYVYSADQGMVFTNTYKADGTLDGNNYLKVSKTFNGWADGAEDATFTFTLAGQDGAPMPSDGGNTVTLNNDTQTGHFGNIAFDQSNIDKTYTYTITEEAGNVGGVTYSQAEYKVQVTVNANGGDLSYNVTMTQVKNDAGDTVNTTATNYTAAFTNTFTPATLGGNDADEDITITKNLTGRAWQAGDAFEFTIEGADEATRNAITNKVVTIPEKMTISHSSADVEEGLMASFFQNIADIFTGNNTVSYEKTGDFGTITFNEADTYTFLIKETEGKLDGITYDGSSYKVTVTVSKDEATNALTASIDKVEYQAADSNEWTKSDADSIVFTNAATASENTKSVQTIGDDNQVIDEDGSIAGVGDILTYTIHWVNNAADNKGEMAPAKVTITDTIPAGTEYVANSATGENAAYDAGTRTLTWTINAAAGAQGDVTFEVKVTEDAVENANNEITNTATVGVNDASYTVTSNPTYVPEKEDSVGEDGSIGVGDPLTYTISYKNTEDTDATITITDVVPEGTQLTEVPTADGATVTMYSDAEGNTTTDTPAEAKLVKWEISNVASGTEGTVTMTVKVVSAWEEEVENSASISIGHDNVNITVDTNTETTPIDEADRTITITPADITVYTGGQSYEGVSDTSGEIQSTRGLPEPGYYITLPAWLNETLDINDNPTDSEATDLSSLLKFTYTDENNSNNNRNWPIGLYYMNEDGTSYETEVEIADVSTARYIYKIASDTSGNNGGPVRVQFTEKGVENATPILSDDFTLDLDTLYQEYDMTIYPGLLKQQEVKAQVQEPGFEAATFDVKVDTGTLTVRGTTNGEEFTSVVTDEDQVNPEQNFAVVETDPETQYHVNDSMVSVNPEDVSLLADELVIGDDAEKAQNILKAHIVEEGIADADANYVYQYLDLVDTTNGNAWVTATKAVDVYWKLPAGTDANDNFQIVHFNGLNRNYKGDTADLIGEEGYAVETYTMDNSNSDLDLEIVDVGGEKYLKFATDSFSPFVLVYDSNDAANPSVTKTLSLVNGSAYNSGSVSVGDELTYTITVTNTGNLPLSDVTVTDTFSGVGDLTYAYSEKYTVNGDTIAIPTLGVGETVTISATYIVQRGDAGKDLTNAAAVKLPGDETPTDEDEIETPVDPITPIRPPVDPDKPELNTEDHYAYIVGYPDGNVKPEGNITRAEVATIFFRLLTDESRDEFWSQTNPYSDVSEDDWYNNAVSTLTNAGIIDGYEDGTFKPNGNITRAEFATIAVRFFEATYEGENLFPDIDGHWAQDYINEAANAGIVDGYPDGTFGPQKLITRAEAMTMVNRTIDRHPHEDHLLDDMIVWPDNPETAWYYEQVQEATNSHEYTMNTDDEQNPYEIWTELLPVRDWAQLEKEWSDAHSGQSGGDVV